MPIIIKARGDDHTGDLIKKFKKIIAATDIIQMVKDRKYYMKPSEVRTVRQNEIRRMHKRKPALKKMKNIPAPKMPTRNKFGRDTKRTYSD